MLPADLTVKSNAEGFNASFLDGHVEWMPWPRFYKWNSGIAATNHFGMRPYSWF